MHKIMRIKIIILIFCVISTGCNKESQAPFEAAKGMIIVHHGGVEKVREAIIDYDEMLKEVYPKQFPVILQEIDGGKVAVILPKGFPAYDLANMTGWLNAPPDLPEVYGAESWLTSPKTDITYYLFPESENKRGDTLLGSTVDGKSVRVYLPETGLSYVSKPVNYQSEPTVMQSAINHELMVTLDTITSFGNPDFVVNKPKDFRWLP